MILKELSKLELPELNNELISLKEDMDEIEMEKTMILGQSGLHISSKKIMQQAKEFEEEITTLKEQIKAVEDEIEKRK